MRVTLCTIIRTRRWCSAWTSVDLWPTLVAALTLVRHCNRQVVNLAAPHFWIILANFSLQKMKDLPSWEVYLDYFNSMNCEKSAVVVAFIWYAASHISLVWGLSQLNIIQFGAADKFDSVVQLCRWKSSRSFLFSHWDDQRSLLCHHWIRVYTGVTFRQSVLLLTSQLLYKENKVPL